MRISDWSSDVCSSDLHHAGDLLIQTAASRTEHSAAPDRVFRIGGDEFAVIVRSPDALRDLDGFATRILEDLTQPLNCNGHAVSPKATIGGAVLGPGDRTARSEQRRVGTECVRTGQSRGL